jgi:hypothetical protein
MYFLKRFQNFDALKAIVLHFILRLMKSVFGIWHFRQVDGNICDVLELVIEIKS